MAGALGAEDWYARLGWRLIRWGTRLGGGPRQRQRRAHLAEKKTRPAAAR